MKSSENFTGLNYLKLVGRVDTVTDPITKRQHLGAFSIDYNSSRYEVYSSYSL